MNLRRRMYLVEGFGRGTVVEIGDLPDALKKALKKIGYRRRDVRIVPDTETSIRTTAGYGSRGFTVAVNMDTGQSSEASMGSWGGQNPYEKKPVDWVDKPVKIPSNGAIIVGTDGSHGMFVTVYVHPSQLVKMLPGETVLTTREQDILGMARFKSGYKKEMFAKHKVTKDELVSLANRGYLKINKAGATSVTAKGKNAGSSKGFY